MQDPDNPASAPGRGASTGFSSRGRWRDPPASTLGYLQSSVAFYSDDHGESWQRGSMMTLNGSDEFEMVEMPDGSVYANMRQRQGHQCRATACSRDRGAGRPR